MTAKVRPTMKSCLSKLVTILNFGHCISLMTAARQIIFRGRKKLKKFKKGEIFFKSNKKQKITNLIKIFNFDSTCLIFFSLLYNKNKTHLNYGWFTNIITAIRNCVYFWTTFFFNKLFNIIIMKISNEVLQKVKRNNKSF